MGDVNSYPDSFVHFRFRSSYSIHHLFELPMSPSLPAARWRHHHALHLNVRRQATLRLQGRFSAADAFRCRFHNVEYDPGRHDAVNYRLQPTNNNDNNKHLEFRDYHDKKGTRN